MTAKKRDSMTDLTGLDNLAKVVDKTVKPEKQKRVGRPPAAYRQEGDTRLTLIIPARLHRQLRLASADKGKPMSEIVVEALIAHLKDYEDR